MIADQKELDQMELLLWEFRETQTHYQAYLVVLLWWLTGEVPDEFVEHLKKLGYGR